MALFGIRNKLKSMVKQALNIEPEESSSTSSYVAPEPVKEPSVSQPVDSEPTLTEEKESETVETESEPPLEVAEEKEKSTPVEDGLPLTMEAVQEILDEDVRPAQTPFLHRLF